MGAAIGHANGLPQYEWNDITRTYTEYDDTGVVLDTRPYTVEENAAADYEVNARALQDAQNTFQRAQALLTFTQLLAVLQGSLLVRKIQPRDPWQLPRDVFESYPKDFVVEYNGKFWRSTRRANIWYPGVQGWVEVP